MAIYSVHLRGEGPSEIAEAAFTREGFDWGAFFFGPFWLARHRLWLAAAAWIGVFFLLLATASFGLLSFSASFTIAVLLEILFGLEANRLLEIDLDARGRHLVEMIAAPTRDEAETAFYRRFAASEADAPAPSGPPSKGRGASSHQDVLGHFPEPGARR